MVYNLLSGYRVYHAVIFIVNMVATPMVLLYSRAVMNKLGTEKRTRIVSALVEGNSIRATCRMPGAAKGTVLKLLAVIGACAISSTSPVILSPPCPNLALN